MICVPAANISGVQPERRNVVAERSSHLCAAFVPSASRHVEVHPGMRIHEVDLRDDARKLDVLVHREVAEAVMRERRGRDQNTRRDQT